MSIKDDWMYNIRKELELKNKKLQVATLRKIYSRSLWKTPISDIWLMVVLSTLVLALMILSLCL